MDSPSLRTFDLEQFWFEQKRDYSFLFDEPILFDKVQDSPPLGYSESNCTTSTSISDSPHYNVASPVVHSEREVVKTEKLPEIAMPKEKVATISKKVRLSKKAIKVEVEPAAPKTTKQRARKYKKRGRKSKQEMFSIKEKQLQDYKATKNLTKNYGNAICNFAISDLAKPYLETILGKEGLSYDTYLSYVNHAKKAIKSIDSFRNCILPSEEDSDELAALKRAFQAIALVFMKYFSVNWVIHGRVNNKLIYLKWRFRIMRRIEEPEIFTYLKFQQKKEEKEVKPVVQAKKGKK